jgi:TfoX/Sxy family transcriptional regulator of competence genes
MSTKTLDKLQDQLSAAAEQFVREDDLVFKRMFGGMGAWAKGHFFAILYTGGIALKLGEEEQAELLKVKGADRFRFNEEITSKQYIVVPAKMRASAEALAPWVERSLKFALAQPLPKRKRRKA